MGGPVSATTGGIFISYRRQETAFPAGWLYDRLRDRFGPDQVFKDVDNIDPGDDFIDKITTAVGSCDVLLALIGQQWVTMTDDAGKRRLDDPEDFVRVEIEAALARQVRVIPLLIDGAPMPRADQLPPSLARLVRRQAQELSPSRFVADANRLVGVLERTLAQARAQREADEQARRQSEQRARAEADERAQRETQEKARVQHEFEDEARREAPARTRQEAEALVERETEDEARREAPARPLQGAEALVKRESDDKARRGGEMITEQPVAFSGGAASVPDTTASVDSAPPAGPPRVPRQLRRVPPASQPSPALPEPTPPASEDGRRGNSRKLVTIGAVVAALLAAGIATAVVLTRGAPSGDKPGGPASTAVAAPAHTTAPPYPTDLMLTRIDTGDAFPKSRTTIAVFTPGARERTTIRGTAGHVLPQWSHDRTRIATTRMEKGGYSVWVMNADGSDARQVVDDTNLARVAWSPDDTTLAFMRTVDGVGQMFTIVIGKSTPRQLTHSKAPKDDPDWSPDGKTIMYWATVNNVRQIFLLSVDHPQEPGRQVTSGDEGPVNDPSWSPDGKTIAYTHVTSNGSSDIWLIDADGRNPRQLTDNPQREWDPTWSPEGTWIGFVRGSNAAPKITIIKADGSREYTLTQDDAREGHPGWS